MYTPSLPTSEFYPPCKTELKIFKSKAWNGRWGDTAHGKLWLKNLCNSFNPLILISCICLRAIGRGEFNILFSQLKSCILLPLRYPRLCFIGSLISTLNGWRNLLSTHVSCNTQEVCINERLKHAQESLIAILKHL